jgi:GTPase involved in cell partitioning and DNA repair
LKDAFEFKLNPDCIFLLANKSDDCRNDSSGTPGKTLADKYGINFLKVSAKTGEGMGDLVVNLATKIDTIFNINQQ